MLSLSLKKSVNERSSSASRPRCSGSPCLVLVLEQWFLRRTEIPSCPRVLTRTPASVWSTTNQIDWIIITMENLSWSNSVKVHISIDVENKPTRMFFLLHHQWRCWSFSFKPWFKTCKNEFIRQYDDRYRNICNILTHRVSRFLTFEHIYEPEVCLASLIRQKSNVFFVFFFWITRCSTAARSVGVRHSGWSELLQLLLLWCLHRVGLIFRSSVGHPALVSVIC